MAANVNDIIKQIREKFEPQLLPPPHPQGTPASPVPPVPPQTFPFAAALQYATLQYATLQQVQQSQILAMQRGSLAQHGLSQGWMNGLVSMVGGTGLASAMQNDARQEEARRTAIEALARKITQLKEASSVRLTGRVPDHCTTLLGWRGWKVADGKLAALGMTGVWEPKQAVKAVCAASKQSLTSSSGHAVPSKDCKCGYWSFKSMELLQAALDSYAERVQVIGSIEHWGKVVECTNGFRSEYAYPKELWLLEEGLEDLSWVYGVPVRRIEV